MDDLIERLHREDCSCVIRNGDVRTFTQRGVADLYDLLCAEPAFLQGAQVADKVVGKGAAALMVRGRIERLYADVISEPAWQLLLSAGVAVTYGQKVPHILNRAGTGWCPVETLCAGIDDPEAMWPLIRDFVLKMRSQS